MNSQVGALLPLPVACRCQLSIDFGLLVFLLPSRVLFLAGKVPHLFLVSIVAFENPIYYQIQETALGKPECG